VEAQSIIANRNDCELSFIQLKKNDVEDVKRSVRVIPDSPWYSSRLLFPLLLTIHLD
jgi:hypothetical protein